MADIFISYATKDREWAKTLADALRSHGWTIWWDRVIPAGRSFTQVIDEALTAARCIIVIWSQESTKSNWVSEEAAEGLKKGILVPVLMENVRMPLGFRSIQAADLIGWDGEEQSAGFQRLISDIALILGPPIEEETKKETSISEPEIVPPVLEKDDLITPKPPFTPEKRKVVERKEIRVKSQDSPEKPYNGPDVEERIPSTAKSSYAYPLGHPLVISILLSIGLGLFCSLFLRFFQHTYPLFFILLAGSFALLEIISWVAKDDFSKYLIGSFLGIIIGYILFKPFIGRYVFFATYFIIFADFVIVSWVRIYKKKRRVNLFIWALCGGTLLGVLPAVFIYGLAIIVDVEWWLFNFQGTIIGIFVGLREVIPLGYRGFKYRSSL